MPLCNGFFADCGMAFCRRSRYARAYGANFLGCASGVRFDRMIAWLRFCVVVLLLATGAEQAAAARVGVLSNKFATETATDFNARIPGHTFTGVDLALGVPTLASLTAAYDAVLLFEDRTFESAPQVGAAVAAYAQSGRAVVLGTFYEQDRTDGAVANTPHGWGALEYLDPNTTDGVGTPYVPRTLDAATLSTHPLTSGLTSLTSTKFAGGNQPKAGSIVVANWLQANALSRPDPAIAYRVTGAACVIHVAIAPHYPVIPGASQDFGGDFDRAWQNAFDFAGSRCTSTLSAYQVPTLSEFALLALTLGLALLALRERRQQVAQR